MLNSTRLDDSMKKYSFLVPVVVFFVNLLGFWDEVTLVYNSLRIYLKIGEAFFWFFLYTLLIAGVYKIVSRRSPSEMMVAFSPYVLLPLLSLLLDPRISILILFGVSVFFLQKVQFKKLFFLILLRLPVVLFLVWKVSLWMR
ncbi:hypothetical protein [Thermotoga sp. KOL6]|uniref:hypothetical protein n=1 Tax=Thermotoga sp. KOL6 TaxID=126741 RepID=UPI000CBD036C|nr:hypothetical protein [Thermotoga sp. KOL6]PLV59445.1 hypothetical protein AS005_06815 [Thermotoga sp. KOL6]